MRIAARAPNHLGDGVMAMPALAALAAVGPTTVYAPAWGADLYRGLPLQVRGVGRMEPAEVAVLFPPSLRVLWQARACGRRVGSPTDHRGFGLTDPVPWTPNTPLLYARLAAAVGGVVQGVPAWTVALTDEAADVPAGHVGLVPVSAGGPTREWRGFGELARRLGRLGRPAVFYGGPGEGARVAEIAGEGRTLVGQSLPELAATLQRCAVLVTNDSGLAHFGRAVGVPVVAIYGSTVPAWTGAPGVVAVQGPALPCRPCRARVCRTGDLACLQIGVEPVLAAVQGVLGG